MSRTENFRKHIDEEFDGVMEYAMMDQTCRRKAVGCSLVTIFDGTSLQFLRAHNGPANEKHECTNEVGNCGCCHAEPRVVIKGLRKLEFFSNCILVCTYSPCTTCANIIIASGLVSLVVYDILTEHDKRGAKLLSGTMPVFTRDELQKGKADAEIKNWIQHHRDSF